MNYFLLRRVASGYQKLTTATAFQSDRRQNDPLNVKLWETPHMCAALEK